MEMETIIDNESLQTENGDDKSDQKKTESAGLIYKYNDNPQWYLCIIFGFQHYVTMLGGAVTYPLIVTSKMCMSDTDQARSQIIATTIFVSGISTLIQSTIGIRLPIIQGSSFSFLIPTLAILELPKWQCTNSTDVSNDWKLRMLEISGAIIVGSVFQIIIGMTGIIGIILRWITPLAIAPTIALIGLSLFQTASEDAGQSWLVSGLTIALMILFSQYLANTDIPIPIYNRLKKFHFKKIPIFGLLPVLLSMGVIWALCGILTAVDVFPEGHAGRTDKGIQLIRDAEWFYIPKPFQWGAVTITVSSVLAIIAGIIASTIESIGDYYACASLSEAPPPPTHAINRGIFIEGIGCVISGIFGAGCGLTSYSQNIGAIGITKVGSRRVVQYASIIMIITSCLLKFSTLFAAMPIPIIGGIFCSVFGVISAVGLSPLQYVNLNSARNLFILGFAIFMGMVIPTYMRDNPGAINTGNDSVDQILTVLLSTGMFIGGFLGFILDNTVPGTEEERGVKKWLEQHNQKNDNNIDVDKCYDIPFTNRLSIRKYIPLCPGYSEDIYLNLFSKKKSSDNDIRQNGNCDAESASNNDLVTDKLSSDKDLNTIK